MNRRTFLRAFGIGIAAAAVDPEALVWTPKKTIFIPPVRTNQFVTTSHVTQEALRILQDNLKMVGYADEWEKIGGKIPRDELRGRDLNWIWTDEMSDLENIEMGIARRIIRIGDTIQVKRPAKYMSGIGIARGTEE